MLFVAAHRRQVRDAAGTRNDTHQRNLIGQVDRNGQDRNLAGADEHGLTTGSRYDLRFEATVRCPVPHEQPVDQIGDTGDLVEAAISQGAVLAAKRPMAFAGRCGALCYHVADVGQEFAGLAAEAGILDSRVGLGIVGSPYDTTRRLERQSGVAGDLHALPSLDLGLELDVSQDTARLEYEVMTEGINVAAHHLEGLTAQEELGADVPEQLVLEGFGDQR